MALEPQSRWKTFRRGGLLLTAAVSVFGLSSLSVVEARAQVPEDPVALFELAQDSHSKGDIKNAIRLYRRALELAPEFPEAEYQLAVASSQAGETDSAEKSFRRALLLREGWTLPMLGLANLLLKRKEFGEAERLFLSVTESEDSNLDAWKGLAEAAIGAGSLERARKAADKVAALRPDEDDTLFLLARVEAAAGNPASALDGLGRIKLPTREALELRRSLVLETSNDTEELEAAHLGNPSDLRPAARLCSLLRTSKPERALAFCKLVLDADPANFEHALRYSAALVQAKRFSEAAAALQELKLREPENRTVRANLATALFQQRLWSEAKAEYLWLSKRQPENSIGFYLLGIVHDELGEFRDARTAYLMFLDKADPSVNSLEIDRVRLRLPALERQIKERRR